MAVPVAKAKKALVNTPSPISSLPNEILVLIFEFGHTLPQATKLPFECLVLQVTRHWRDVAISVPRLWTSIIVSPIAPAGMLAAYLQRSRSFPIDLTCDLEPNPPDDDSQNEHVIGLWKMVVPHAARWRRLSIEVNCISLIVDSISALFVPFLERLEITSRTEISRETFSIFRGGAPALKSLLFVGVTLNSCRPPLDSLTYLTLSESRSYILYSQFLDILAALPCLEDLGLFGSIVTDWPVYPTIKIELPALATFRLANPPTPMCSPFFTIVAPTLRSLSLYGIFRGDFPQALTGDRIHANFPSIQSLTLMIPKSVMIETSVAHEFPAITHLTLLGVDPHNTILQQLLHENHPTGSLVWPNLHTITLSSPSYDISFLCDFLSSRIAIGHPISTLVIPQPDQIAEIEWLREHVHVEEFQGHSFQQDIDLFLSLP